MDCYHKDIRFLAYNINFYIPIGADIQAKGYGTYVTRSAKRGLPYTSNVPISTVHNSRLVAAIDLKFLH